MGLRFALLLALAQPFFAADFTATFLHVNDTHDRIEPTIIQTKPYGGMPRLATLIERYRKSDPNAIVLHGGDAFQGTFYFNVYEGLADVAFLNALHLDAMTIGNHEFDKGPATLGLFARNAQFPLVSANLDVSAEPTLKDLVRTSVVVTRGKERVGIVGGITDQLLTISNVGPNVKLRDTAAALQAEIDGLTRQGINKIVLLTHIGYEDEQKLARTLHGVDVIVGGHSHTLLGSTTAPGWPKSWGPYPTVVDNPDKGKTLVVQSWEGEKVLGRLQVTFDDKGRVKSWSDSQPVAVDESIPEDPTLKALVAAFQKPLVQQRDRKIATASGIVPQVDTMGELIADAMLAATEKQGAVVALMNKGGVRAAFEAGDITYGNAITVQPFGNTLVLLDATGAQLQQAIEDIVEGVRSYVLYVSRGSSYNVDPRKPTGARVSNLVIAGKPVDPNATYRVVTNNFVADGGDSVATLKAIRGYRYDTGILDIDAFSDYLATHSPISGKSENRVTTR